MHGQANLNHVAASEPTPPPLCLPDFACSPALSGLKGLTTMRVPNKICSLQRSDSHMLHEKKLLSVLQDGKS